MPSVAVAVLPSGLRSDQSVVSTSAAIRPATLTLFHMGRVSMKAGAPRGAEEQGIHL